MTDIYIRTPRFSIICAKNQVLNIIINKVAVILRLDFPSSFHARGRYLWRGVPYMFECILILTKFVMSVYSSTL